MPKINGNLIPAGELTLCNGCAQWAQPRTVASELRLAPSVLLQYLGTRSRWTGTGYHDSLYRIHGTDDRVVVSHNDGPVDNLGWANASLEKGYFAQARAYGAACREAARQHGLTVEAVLAVGPENAAEFAVVLRHIVELGDADFHELGCGINRRKTEQRRLFAEAGASEQLTSRLSCGQQNSCRISDAICQAHYERRVE